MAGTTGQHFHPHVEKIGEYRIGLRIEGLKVYPGYEERTGEQVAVKLEPLGAARPSLYYGTRILKLLQGGCKFH
jgi:hypothetical protein